MRKVLIITGVVLALLVAVAAALPLLIDVNTHRALIQAKAEEAIGRPVKLGEMTLRVFPSFGIRVNDPEVDGLLRARSLTVGVRIFPLLFGGTVEVRRVILDHPEIDLARGRDGVWNFESIGSPGEGTPPSSAPAAPETPARPFSLGKLQIVSGAVRIHDETRRAGGPLDLSLGLDLTASASRSAAGDLDTAFDGRLQGEGILLDLRGKLSKGAGPTGRTAFDVTVDQADLQVARGRDLASAFGASWPLPDGILKGPSLRAKGRATAEIQPGAPARIALSGVEIDGGELALARDRSGRWNFESLMEESAAGAPDASAGAAAPILTIDDLAVKGATVSFHDEATGGAGPVDLVLKDLDVEIGEMAPDRPIKMKVRSKITPGKGTLEATGTLPASFEKGREAAVDAEVDLKEIDARAVAPYLETLLGLKPRAGALSARAKLTGGWPGRVDAAGAIELDGIELPPAPRPLTAKADFQIGALEGGARLEIAKLTVASGGSRLDLRGSIDNRSGGTRVDLEIPPSSIQAADLASLMLLAGAASPVEFSSSRPVRLQARARGDVRTRQDLKLSGSVEVEDFTLRHPMLEKPIEKVKGRLALHDNGFDVADFSGVIGASDVAGTMSVTDLGAPRVTFNLTSRHADFWELMSFLKEEPAGAPSPKAESSGSGGGEDPLSKVTARGTLSIGEGSFGTLAFTGLTSTLQLARKVVRLEPVSMKLYGGTMSGSADLDLSREPAVYAVTASVGGVDTDALLAANLQMKGTLSGALSGDLSITTSGAGRDAALANARGTGQVRIDNGHVGALNVLKVLSRASDLLGEKSLKEVSGRMAKEGTDFSELTADLKVAGGKITSDRLRLVSPDMEMKDAGELDMMAGTVNIAGQIIFSEAISTAMVAEKSKAVDYFWDDKRGRVNLPLTMSGPVASPTPGIDWSSAGGRLARRKVTEKVSDKLREAGLGDLLGDRGGKDPRDLVTGKDPGGSPGEAPPKMVGSEPAPVPGTLSVAIQESGYGGNLLLPDLKVKGTIHGTGITAATVRVLDDKGRVLHEESLAGKIGKYYAAHDRAAPAAINFRVEVEGKKLAGSRKGVTVEIEATDGGGGAVKKSIEVTR